MDGEPLDLTPEQQQYVLSLLRSGTFPRVALETAGMLWADFRRWQAQEQRQGRGKQVHAFRVAMRQAAAQSRAKAELEVREKSPLLWLKHGPGRDLAGNPGWANPPKPGTGAKKGSASGGLESPRIQAFLGELLDVFQQFPEARAAAVATVDRAGRKPITPADAPHNKTGSAETPAPSPTDDASPTHG